MDIKEFQRFTESFCEQDKYQDHLSKVPDVIKLFHNANNHTEECIASLGLLSCNILKKAILTKRVSVLPGNDSKIDYDNNLMEFHKQTVDVLRNLVSQSGDEKLQIASLQSLLSMLPIKSKFGEKPKFPVSDLALILESVVLAETNIDSLLNLLDSYMHYQDVAVSLWESLKKLLTFNSMRPLKPNHVKNIISIINLNKNKIEDLKKSLCGQMCKFNKKKIGVIVRAVWDKLASVKIEDNLQQKLSLTLIEHIMPIIDQPVILTDYFMFCLNIKGPNALIALQGIFNLIQKFNINYPNFYNKLYTMFEPGIFDTPYKARFYYLSDVFLTSLCLPQGMVAGFIKRFSRLSLVAPPEDIVILMAFITNLLIRHPNLKYLINSPSFQSVECDPYDYNEVDPAKSHATESSLWEVKLLQEHVLPNVSAAAMFINDPLPSTEKDLANLLENSSDQIFIRECKKKFRGGDVPVNFENPNSMRNNNCSALSFWNVPIQL